MEVTMAVQLDLPLEKSSPSRRTYYSAWARSGMQLPYDPKSRERAICSRKPFRAVFRNVVDLA